MIPSIKHLVNAGVAQYLKMRYKRLQQMMDHPIMVQDLVLKKLLHIAQSTEYGKKYHFHKILKAHEFGDRLPVQDYDSVKPYIDRMILGEKDVLWSGTVKWFSKSSGTTSDKSKYIPVTRENLYYCHLKGSWDTLTFLYHVNPDIKLFAKKNLILGGSLNTFPQNQGARNGDISAIMLHHMPSIGRPFYVPDFEVALLSDWEEKIERTANQLLKCRDLVMFGGVPTWNLVLFKHLLEKTGKKHLLELFPGLKAYIHGGVGFEPYRNEFKRILPANDFMYMEVYNASEGYFAVSDTPSSGDMFLLLDNGIYYEFIETEQFFKGSYKIIPLAEVKPHINYTLVISTNSGLWRYMPGDTVTFTSVNPYRIKITGRTQQFINTFGEEVVISNTDEALARTCLQFGVIANEYTVAPVFMVKLNKGGHQWVIEFEEQPSDLDAFADALDLNLQQLNSDYEAKRSKSLALDRLVINAVKKGTFMKWLQNKGKLGGQNKVPRLSNNRKVLDEVLTVFQNTGL